MAAAERRVKARRSSRRFMEITLLQFDEASSRRTTSKQMPLGTSPAGLLLCPKEEEPLLLAGLGLLCACGSGDGARVLGFTGGGIEPGALVFGMRQRFGERDGGAGARVDE